MANCYACKAEIVFDNEHVGRNGRKIPLDPATKQPHDCPMREKKPAFNQFDNVNVEAEDQWLTEKGREELRKAQAQEKNDHGNEEVFPSDKISKAYVDHTLKGQSKVKIFVSENVDELQQLYNQFLKSKNGEIKTQGAQFQMNNEEVAIALYYEEVAKQ